MATLNHVVLFPKIPRLQLGSVPRSAHKLHKLHKCRTIGVACALRGENFEVGKRGPKSSKKGDEEVKVAGDPKLRLELKVKIASLECNARKAKCGRLRGHTLGVDLGDAKTGLSVSLGGFAPRPLSVSFLFSSNSSCAECEHTVSSLYSMKCSFVSGCCIYCWPNLI